MTLLTKLRSVTTIMFEWDQVKSLQNLKKHGLTLDQSLHVFNDFYLEIADLRKDYGEDRYIVLGILLGRVVVLVYTPRSDKKRIISLRKANEREKKIYKQRLQALGCNA